MTPISGIFNRVSLPVLLVLLLASPGMAQQAETEIDFSTEIGNKYFDAIDYLESNRWMYDTLVKANISPDFAYSIVFPSLTRYSTFKDIMETGGLRTLYVQSGRKYAYYTVGRFMMRPSFVELIERNATRYKLTKHKFMVSNTIKSRSERAKRLDSPEWQVEYLILFIKLMDKRFSHLEWKTPGDKVRFYSTAFNVGFNKNERAIKQLMSKKTLYKQANSKNSKYRHGDIAIWFFTNDGYRFGSNIPIIPKVDSAAVP